MTDISDLVRVRPSTHADRYAINWSAFDELEACMKERERFLECCARQLEFAGWRVIRPEEQQGGVR